jgi:hypothetical protein
MWGLIDKQIKEHCIPDFLPIVGRLIDKQTKEQSRVYGFVMKNPKQVGEGKPDNDLFKKIK